MMSGPPTHSESEINDRGRGAFLYLDHADWNALIKEPRSGPQTVGPLRRKLLDLASDGRVTTIVSWVHALELVGMFKNQQQEGIAFVKGIPGALLSRATPEAICEAEVDRPGSPPDLGLVDIWTGIEEVSSDPALSWLKSWFPRFWSGVLSLNRFAELRGQIAKTSGRLDESRALKSERMLNALLSGEPWRSLSKKDRSHGMRPGLAARAAVAVARPLRAYLSDRGMTKEGASPDVDHASALAWAMYMGAERLKVLSGIPVPWDGEQCNARPACALRYAFERSRLKDPGRRPARSDHADSKHLAFAAYCRYSSVDRRVLWGTAGVRRHLRSSSFHQAGHLGQLLELVAAED